jgi:hypothetical protein
MMDQLASALVNLLLALGLLVDSVAAQRTEPPTAPLTPLACETAAAEQMESCP